VVEELHGRLVADPFRSLEDIASKETVAWVAAENRLTDSYFATVPGQESLRTRLAAVSSYEQYGLPRHHGDRYFWTYTPGSRTSGSP
jgi:prolyl oligopeptidase